MRGKVHEFNGSGDDNCREIDCDKPRDNEVHQFVADSGCYHPEVRVQVFTGRDLPGGGIHYAEVAFQAENDHSWYSAWFAPHNQPGTWHRVPEFDSKSAFLVAASVVELMTGRYTEAELNEKGMTSQYIVRNNRLHH